MQFGTLPDGPLRRFAKCQVILPEIFLDEVVIVCGVQFYRFYQFAVLIYRIELQIVREKNKLSQHFIKWRKLAEVLI